MGKFNELLTKLSNLTIIQKNGDWRKDIPEDIWQKYLENGNYEKVAFGLEREQHRHYEASITVIKIFDRYLGIKHITTLYSEMSDYIDCYHFLEFMEMEEITVKTYKKIPFLKDKTT